MIIEQKADYPLVLLNTDRYAYYKECERKSNFTDKQIREEAIEMFKGWAEKTDFKVEISMLTLHKTFINSRMTSFFCEWYKDRYIGNKELEDIGFRFEQSINDAVNKFVSEAYKEHRQELENEFNARISKRHKSYINMRKLCVISFMAIVILLIAILLLLISI